MPALSITCKSNKVHGPKVARFSSVFLAFAALSLSTANVSAQSAETENKVIGTFAGQEITTQDLEVTIGEMGAQLGNIPEEQRQFAALMALIDIKLVAKKAEEDGVTDDEDFKRRLAFLRERTLHNVLFRSQVVDAVNDEEVRARYDKEIAATPAENEINAAHILVEKEEDAKAIIVELEGGADFAELAKTKSTGPSGPNGGDLGYFTKGRMVPEFEQAAFGLDTGSFTKEPVKTQFGYHVILIKDIRPVQPPAFEQAQQQIRQALLREKYFNLLKSLRADAGIDITDPALKSAYDEAVANQNQQQ